MGLQVEEREGNLQVYRAAAAELHDFSLGVERKLVEAGETGELSGAKEALTELRVRTKIFEDLRATLTPADLFLAKYGVVVHDNHTVSFVLPKGVSRIEILQEAQELIQQRDDRDLIWPSQLTEWQQQEEFTATAVKSERIGIDGHVEGGDAKTRVQQAAFLASHNPPLTMPSLEDLAVAFAVHWVATGQPLFGWKDEANQWSYVVRAAGGALCFFSLGLCVNVIDDGIRNGDVAVASRVLPELKTR